MSSKIRQTLKGWVLLNAFCFRLRIVKCRFVKYRFVRYTFRFIRYSKYFDIPVSILLQNMSSRPMFAGTVLWYYYGFVTDIVDPVEKASMVGKCLLRIVCFEVTSFFILFYRRY